MHKLVKLTNTMNLIATWSVRLAKNHGLGLKISEWQKYSPYCIIEQKKKVAYCPDLLFIISINNFFYVYFLFHHKVWVSEKSP